MSRRSERPTGRIFTSLDGELFQTTTDEEKEAEVKGYSAQHSRCTTTPSSSLSSCLPLQSSAPYVPATTNPREEPNFLSQMMGSSVVRRRLGGGGGAGNHPPPLSAADSSTIPTANIVATDISREAQLRMHLLSVPQQVNKAAIKDSGLL